MFQKAVYWNVKYTKLEPGDLVLVRQKAFKGKCKVYYYWLSSRGSRLTGILVTGVLLLVVNSGSLSIVEQS